jgi:hypothetical protein
MGQGPYFKTKREKAAAIFSDKLQRLSEKHQHLERET